MESKCKHRRLFHYFLLAAVNFNHNLIDFCYQHFLLKRLLSPEMLAKFDTAAEVEN